MENDSLQLLKVRQSPLLSWVDAELADNYQLNFNNTQSSDILLELRSLLSSRLEKMDLKRFIAQFYKLLPRLEQRYYLLGYRMRQWLSLSYELILEDPLERVAAVRLNLQQDFKSISEAKKGYFEDADYEVPYHDIRVKVIAR